MNGIPAGSDSSFGDWFNAIAGQVPLVMANTNGDHFWQARPCPICVYYRQLTVKMVSPLQREMCKWGVLAHSFKIFRLIYFLIFVFSF